MKSTSNDALHIFSERPTKPGKVKKKIQSSNLEKEMRRHTLAGLRRCPSCMFGPIEMPETGEQILALTFCLTGYWKRKSTLQTASGPPFLLEDFLPAVSTQSWEGSRYINRQSHQCHLQHFYPSKNLAEKGGMENDK